MNLDFMQALDDIEKTKGIPKETLLDATEAALISAYKKHFGSSQNVRVEIDEKSGKVIVLSHRQVVEEPEDNHLEISLEEARSIDISYELDDYVEQEVTPTNFGRIAAQTAKQVVIQRIREAERDIIFTEYKNREGDIITGLVQRESNKNIIIDLGKAEAILIPPEQMRSDKYTAGERIKLYIVEVKQTTKGPRIMVSRTHPGLLKRLFELEVPEVYGGIVIINSVAREAGVRSKIAVSSKDPDVDAVGSCVGPRGMRVKSVVDELRGEKIDIVTWDEKPEIFVANALSPSEVMQVTIIQEKMVARVIVPDYQLSLAIGKAGQNARLAAKLTGWRIDIKSESQAQESSWEDEKQRKTQEEDLEKTLLAEEGDLLPSIGEHDRDGKDEECIGEETLSGDEPEDPDPSEEKRDRDQ